MPKSKINHCKKFPIQRKNNPRITSEDDALVPDKHPTLWYAWPPPPVLLKLWADQLLLAIDKQSQNVKLYPRLLSRRAKLSGGARISVEATLNRDKSEWSCFNLAPNSSIFFSSLAFVTEANTVRKSRPHF